MAKAKTKEASTISVKIKDLKITSEDEWLDNWIADYGSGVERSPQYLALRGKTIPLASWMESRDLDFNKRLRMLHNVYNSIKAEGQKTPIKIYKDMRINTGHKRASAMLALGFDKIKAEIVPDDYKL